MIESSGLEEESIIKDAINLFRLKKKTKTTDDTTIKDIRNLFRLKRIK